MNNDYFIDYESLTLPQPPPLPGEIWEISKNFNNYLTSNHYLMIIDKLEEHIYSGLVISDKTEFVSDSNLIVPKRISGTSQDLLVETTNLINVLDYFLVQKVGKRLSRQLYDLLLDLYDYRIENQHDFMNNTDFLGLIQGNKNQANPIFDSKEQEWINIITKKTEEYKLYNLVSQILDETIINEQELAKLNNPVILFSQWLENIFISGWQNLLDLNNTQNYNLGFALRNEANSQTIQGIKSLSLGESEIEIKISIEPEQTGKLNIRIELIPPQNQRYLPKNLQVNIVNNNGEILKSFQTRNSDNFLKLPNMKLSPGGEFILEINLGEIKIREKFVHD